MLVASTATSIIDMCFAAIIALPSRRMFSFGFKGMPFSCVGGLCISYLIPPIRRANNNTPRASVMTKKLFSFLFINPTSRNGVHSRKYIAKIILNKIVRIILSTFFDSKHCHDVFYIFRGPSFKSFCSRHIG